MSCFSCAKKKEKPSFIQLKYKNDSVFIWGKSTQVVPTFLTAENKKTHQKKQVTFKTRDSAIIYQFHQQEIDTSQLFNTYSFALSYGNPNLKKYDTTYNYNLPFSKGKRYRVLQGNNGGFSHNKPTSRYAIDFTMNIGQEVCAIREGYVVMTKSDSNEGGSSKKYLPKANKVFVYHKDGTFAQYAHFRQNGVVVKAGDSIKKGQLIGYSGNTGYSTQPHLHFVVYKPSKNGLISIPFVLDSIPSKRYKRGKYAVHN